MSVRRRRVAGARSAYALFAFLLAIPSAPAHALVVWCVGDSIAGHYCPVLARMRPRWTVVTRGVPGEQSADGLERLEVLLTAKPSPDVVVLNYGTNDALVYLGGGAASSAAAAARNLQFMADGVRRAGAIPIIALPLPGLPRPTGNEDLDAYFLYQADLRALLRAERPIVDFRIGGPMFKDLLHPNPRGAKVLARRAARAIRRVLGPSA